MSQIVLISDRRARSFETIWPFLPRAARAGLTALMIREKDLPGGPLVALGREAVRRCRPLGIEVLVNDRIDVALACGADGVHLGVASIPVSEARRLVRERLKIGASTHSLEELREAERQGADYAVFGPVFETASKASHGPPLGVALLRAAAAHSSIPVLALGGIALERIAELEGTAIAGVAAISAILRAEDPAEAVRRLAMRLDEILLPRTPPSRKAPA